MRPGKEFRKFLFPSARVFFYSGVIACILIQIVDSVTFFQKSNFILLYTNIINILLIGVSSRLFYKLKIGLATASLIFGYSLLTNLFISDLFSANLSMPLFENVYTFQKTFIFWWILLIGGYGAGIRHLFFLVSYSVICFLALHIFSDQIPTPEYLNELGILLLGSAVGFAFHLNALYKSFCREKQLSEELLYASEKIHITENELQAEQNRLLSFQLEAKQKELTANTLQAIQQIENYHQLIDALNNLIPKDQSLLNIQLEMLISKHKVQKRATYWDKFELSYIGMHNGFYSRITSGFPNLSLAERRLAALIHLNLSSKEIALLLGIQLGSVEVSRSRLRSKMNIQPGIRISDFLSCLDQHPKQMELTVA